MKFYDYLNEQHFRWSEELPKKPGWYWVKNTSNGEKFIRYFDGKNIVTGIKQMPIKEYNGEKGPEGEKRLWAGPIPEPK